MTTYVFDASALLAVILDEPGGDVTRRYTSGAMMTTVNAAEVFTRCIDKGISIGLAESLMLSHQIELVAFDLDLARAAASLRAATKKHGLSLGDRTCIALALRKRSTILTADRIWSTLDLGCPVELIR